MGRPGGSHKTFEQFGFLGDRTGIVNQRTANLRRAVVGLLTLTAWFIISNHCALGALSAAEPMQCHHDQSSPANKSGDEEMPCCKVLRATIIAPAKVPAADFTGLAPLTAWISKVVSFDDRQIQPVSYRIDTGPPFAISFAELILQRSLLSHAPPSLS